VFPLNNALYGKITEQINNTCTTVRIKTPPRIEKLLSDIADLEFKFDFLISKTESVETWELPDWSEVFVTPRVAKHSLSMG
jgi:hypothetical protein